MSLLFALVLLASFVSFTVCFKTSSIVGRSCFFRINGKSHQPSRYDVGVLNSFNSNNNANNNYNWNNNNNDMIRGNGNSGGSMSSEGDGNPPPQIERSTTPARNDVCRVFVTGVVGTEPRETYLANGHYVINFALATVGHFDAQHEWERFKPTETMWLSSEIWDEEAKDALNNGILRKGAKLAGMGTLIYNKWQDKMTGEDRKVLKTRILQILNREDIERLGLDDGLAKPSYGAQQMGDVYQESPELDNQMPPAIEESSSDRMPENVWPSNPPKRKLNENINGDFDGFADDEQESDPRIPF
jgi:single-stranded DNA-binding protein